MGKSTISMAVFISMAMLVYRRVNPHSEHPKFLGLVDVGHLRYQTEIDQAQTAILQQHPAQGMTFFWGKNEPNQLLAEVFWGKFCEPQ